jgi:hypothetical protein
MYRSWLASRKRKSSLDSGSAYCTSFGLDVHWLLHDSHSVEKLEPLMALPFKITAQPAGTQKAYEHMVQFYGKKEGERIFLKKAEEQGSGNTIRQKCNSIYKKGSHVG